MELSHPANELESTQDNQIEQTNPIKTPWVQPLLITASIIAAVGIAIILWGSSTNSPTVVFIGLITFSTAISAWALPLAFISYWLFKYMITSITKRT